MAETVLVTGGTGYVAGWCIAQLLNAGYAVRTTLRDLSKEAAVRAWIAPVADACDRLSIFRADLMNDAGWAPAVKGCDSVWRRRTRSRRAGCRISWCGSPRFDPALRELTPGLGRKHVFSSAKAQRVLGWAPRRAKATIIECAESLIAKGAA